MSTRDPLAAMEAHLAEMHEAFALAKGKRKDGVRTHIPAPKTERGRQSAQARGYRPPRSGSGDWVHVSVTPRDERLPAPPPPPKAPKPKPAAPATTGAPSIEDLTAHARRDPAWARRAIVALKGGLGRLEPDNEAERDFHRELAQELVFAWEDADPPTKEGLARVMLAMGLRRIGEAGETVPFDGLHHATKDDLLPGETAHVVVPGWRLMRGARSWMLGKATVSAAPPAPAASPDKVLDEMRRMNPRLGEGGLVSLPDLRQRLGLPKAAFDAMVLEMADARHIALHRSDRAASMRPDDRAALVQDDRGHSYNAASLWTTDSERKPAVLSDKEANRMVLETAERMEMQWRSGAPVLLEDLRKRMPTQLDKETFDRHILRMADDDVLALHGTDSAHLMPPEERDDLVVDEQENYYIAASLRRNRGR